MRGTMTGSIHRLAISFEQGLTIFTLEDYVSHMHTNVLVAE